MNGDEKYKHKYQPIEGTQNDEKLNKSENVTATEVRPHASFEIGNSQHRNLLSCQAVPLEYNIDCKEKPSAVSTRATVCGTIFTG